MRLVPLVDRLRLAPPLVDLLRLVPLVALFRAPPLLDLLREGGDDDDVDNCNGVDDNRRGECIGSSAPLPSCCIFLCKDLFFFFFINFCRSIDIVLFLDVPLHAESLSLLLSSFAAPKSKDKSRHDDGWIFFPFDFASAIDVPGRDFPWKPLSVTPLLPIDEDDDRVLDVALLVAESKSKLPSNHESSLASIDTKDSRTAPRLSRD